MKSSTTRSSSKAPKPIVDRAFIADGGYRLFHNQPWRDRLFEVPIQICAHCQCRVVMNPERKRPRGHCGRCVGHVLRNGKISDGYVCDDAGCQIDCRHLPRSA